MSGAPGYDSWFQGITGFSPHPWQSAVAKRDTCEHALIRVPTGMGKTAGTVLAWLYHRVVRGQARWPRRLVFVLPMRVLVEQVERTVRGWRDRAGKSAPEVAEVAVHVLMGGVRVEPWVLHPEKPAILIGTQDMILSRALNRGFGAARGRWPMDFGLLHHDALWVLDEVQLMDVSLMTSVQLAVFRDGRAGAGTEDDIDDAGRATHRWPRPIPVGCTCWWMSATLQPGWLESVDSRELVTRLVAGMLTIPESDRQSGPWRIRKPAERRADIGTAAEIAALAQERHAAGTLSLVIVNRVDRAVAVFGELEKGYSEGSGKKRRLRDDAPDLRLIHSRFRGAERDGWAGAFLHRDADLPAAGRVVVSTQVIEAGVDISARLLITELAPWSSLVQRAGRAGRVARDDGAAVIAVGAVPGKAGDALPYGAEALAAAAEAWELLCEREGDASLAAMTRFEERLQRERPDWVADELYPYQPEQVLQRSDVADLFDTTPDLTGADLDVSGFVRSGEERDVSVFWRTLPDGSGRRPKQLGRDAVGKVHRRELCPVPVAAAQSWLGKVSAAYLWDYLDGRWVRLGVGGVGRGVGLHVEARQLAPGAIVLVTGESGGYDPARGWDGKSKGAVSDARPAAEGRSGAADEPGAGDPDAHRFADSAAAQDDDSLSHSPGSGFKTIGWHGKETGDLARELGEALGIAPRYRDLLQLAGRWHDAGKAHPVFQDAIKAEARDRGPTLARRRDLAKAPASAWRRPDPYPARPGFRHELASTLALFELLRRCQPDHDALLGGCRAMLEATGVAIEPVSDDLAVDPDHPLAREIVALDRDDFDLLAYLVCAHHGKVRCSWVSTPRDQQSGQGAMVGVVDGDVLDGLELYDDQGAAHAVPALTLDLRCAGMGLNGRHGRSWTERVAGLRKRLGPFGLAYLEAVLRAADARASQLNTPDDQEGEGAGA